MDSLTGAWLLGVGIYSYRTVSQSHRIPVPGALLGVTLLFVGLGMVAEIAPSSARAMSLIGWGLDLAGLLRLFSGGKLPGEVTQAQASETAAAGPASP